MRSKIAKQIRKTVNEIIPTVNIVGMNIYRNTKKSYNNKVVPKDIDTLITRYEDLHKRIETAKKIKYIKREADLLGL